MVMFATELWMDRSVIDSSVSSLGLIEKQYRWVFDVVSPKLPINPSTAEHFIPRALNVE